MKSIIAFLTLSVQTTFRNWEPHETPWPKRPNEDFLLLPELIFLPEGIATESLEQELFSLCDFWMSKPDVSVNLEELFDLSSQLSSPLSFRSEYSDFVFYQKFHPHLCRLFCPPSSPSAANLSTLSAQSRLWWREAISFLSLCLASRTRWWQWGSRRLGRRKSSHK